MPRYAIIDTETSGLFDFRQPADAEGQPRLASFTMLLTHDDGTLDDGMIQLVRPDGWEIGPEVTAINGLTTEQCAATGIPVVDVLLDYQKAIDAGYVVVAFNAQYDTKVMRGEFRRAGMPDLFEITPNICVMRASHKLGIQKAGEKKGGFPKLSDAYRHVTGEDMKDAHTSAGDAQACLIIFQHLLKTGQLPEPAVHFAKNPPPGKAA